MHFPTTSYILLGMLSSQEMSGYDLKQQLDKSLYPCYDSPAKSQIYGELRRLTRQSEYADDFPGLEWALERASAAALQPDPQTPQSRGVPTEADNVRDIESKRARRAQ